MTKPHGKQAPFIDAVALFRAGKLDLADRKCRQIVGSDPTHVDAMHLRAMIAMNRQDTPAAIDLMQRALAIKPRDATLLCNLGNMHMALGQTSDALARFLAAVTVDPHQEQARLGAAAALLEQGEFMSAEPHLRAVLAKAPRSLEALIALARALDGQGRAREAADTARKAVAVAPQDPAAEARLANALDQLDDFDLAYESHRRTLLLSGKAPFFWLDFVASLAAFGKIAEAEAECRALIAAHPDFAAAHVRLATLVRKSGEAERSDLKRLLERSDLSPRDRIQVEFALGSALEGHDSFAEAISHFQTGNELARALSPYDPKRAASDFAAIKSAFVPDVFARLSGEAGDNPSPVFVVGMPRSGTTLVEQILSSHPDIAGAGELEAVPRLIMELAELTAADSVPSMLARATADQLARLGQAYRAEIRSIAGTARFVVDKLPANFLHLGFISLFLPDARIVHCRRDPLDTCLSIYTTRFVQGSVQYGYDQTELGQYYRRYDDLMQHWEKVLPRQPVEIVYENLVADTRGESERLLVALGLEWSEACMHFYDTKRSVHTASMAQVRRPIYNSSVGRAARFGAALDPLRAALTGAGAASGSGADA